MISFNKEKIESLSDVFAAWFGGYPEDNAEIRAVLEDKKISKLFSTDDIYVILHHNVYLSDKTREAVYALLPATLTVKGKEYALFAQTFNKINKHNELLPEAGIIDAPILETVKTIRMFAKNKLQYMHDNSNKLRAINNKFRASGKTATTYLKRKLNLSEEQLEEQREKARLRMRRYRLEHPESVKIQNDKSKNSAKTPMQKLDYLLKARARNKKYREENKDAIKEKNRIYREKERLENPQRAKERNAAYRQTDAAKEVTHRYYEKHKAEIALKAKNNPKTAIYKQRYKRKMRLKKTGPVLLSLLEAIVKTK